jgi:hypothetical protein
MTKRDRISKIDSYFEHADRMATKLVEDEARKLLVKYPGLYREYVMAMGACFFTDWKDNPIEKYNKPTRDFLDMVEDFDDQFKTMGQPMRLTAAGEVSTTW